MVTDRNKTPACSMSVYKLNVFTCRAVWKCKAFSSRNMHLLQDKAFVNGRWIAAASNNTFQVTNPADGCVIGVVPDMNTADVQQAIGAAKSAFDSWQNTTAKERGKILRKWFDLMEQNGDELAKIMTAESGKPITESKGEVVYGNSFIDLYAEEARRINGEIIQSPMPSKKILIERQPIGVAALITPWNFPHAMITRKAGAALAAGCTVVVKPAEDTPLTALALAKLAEEAGVPQGVFNVITCDRKNASDVGNLLCTSDDVAGVSFTGSTAVGKILYRQCAQGIKRLGLELGGNAPLVVFNSANLAVAVNGTMASKFRNCGQTCVSANRLLIQSKIYDSYVDELSKAIKGLKQGRGDEAGVTAGPLINKAQFDKVSALVKDALDKGAKAVVGGKPAPQLGDLFYEPTMLVNVTSDMRVYNEEVFGPIATVLKFETEEEGIKIANSTNSGLAGYFFSEDVNQIFRVARKMEVGMVGVNEGLISCAEAAFGGIKESGLGREGSHHGIEEYTYYKYVCVGNLN